MIIDRKTFVTGLFFLPVLWCPLVGANAPFIEYSHWGQEEENELNSPRLFDGEYQSDRLTYEFLNEWNALWWKQDKVFQYTAGSLGPTRFLTQGRMKIREQIFKNLYFSFIFSEVGDYTQSRQNLVFEFSYQFHPWFEINFYGQPSTLKKQDDIGLAFTTNFTNFSSLRLFYTWVDFSLNKRNENSDFYIEQPGALGLVWRHSESLDSKNFWEVFFKRDQPTKHIFSDSRFYSFRQNQVGIKAVEGISRSGDYIQLEINGRSQQESDTSNQDEDVAQWETRIFDTLLQFRHDYSWLSLYGVRVSYSEWGSIQGKVIHNDILPHVWFRFMENRDGSFLHKLHMGYELTWHRGQGKSFYRSQLDTDHSINHRINFRYGLSIQSKTQLNLLLTLDGDKFGTGETWEGGSLQFSQFF